MPNCEMCGHPVFQDDSVPCDEAWLRSVGFEVVIAYPSIISEEGEIFTYRDGSLWCGDMRLVSVKTRGTVRSLARVLGIHLTGDVQ